MTFITVYSPTLVVYPPDVYPGAVPISRRGKAPGINALHSPPTFRSATFATIDVYLTVVCPARLMCRPLEYGISFNAWATHDPQALGDRRQLSLNPPFKELGG